MAIEFVNMTCPTCGSCVNTPEGSVFRLPGDEIETMAEGIAVLNEFGHRETNTWKTYLNVDRVEVAMNHFEFTALNEAEVVAVARWYKRGKGV